MAQFETLIYEKLGGLAHVSLNRAQVLNAYNIQMRDDLSQALAAVAEDPGVGALLITGQGRAFCAGADLTEFGTAPSQVVARRVRLERDVWGQLLALKQPVVCAVHGFCIGSGLEIALLCDLRLAARGTVFAMPEVQLGMIPAAGGTQTLSRSAGGSQALELVLTGRRFGADEALAMGLISRVVEDADLLQAGLQLAQSLSAQNASIPAKAAMVQGSDLTLAHGLALEQRLAACTLAEAAPDRAT